MRQRTQSEGLVRDRKAEELAATQKLVSRTAEIRQARESNDGNVMQLAQALILCGLPYVPTKERQLSKHARVADGSQVEVTFGAALPGVDMAFGSDRTLLHYILNKAVRASNRYVSWDSTTHYLNDMGIKSDGGKSYADLRLRFERLRGLTISVTRKGSGHDATSITPFISRSEMPSSMDIHRERKPQASLPLSSGMRYGMELGEGFWNDLKAYPVPVSTVLLRQTRGNPQLQDNCVWLQYRCWKAKGESLIPWKYLREQSGSADSNPWRIKAKFQAAIKILTFCWPEMKAEARAEGLWVAPPKNGVAFILGTEEARRI